jgi:hypothetical protein
MTTTSVSLTALEPVALPSNSTISLMLGQSLDPSEAERKIANPGWDESIRSKLTEAVGLLMAGGAAEWEEPGGDARHTGLAVRITSETDVADKVTKAVAAFDGFGRFAVFGPFSETRPPCHVATFVLVGVA